MNRSPSEWLEVCDRITAGYTPGGEKRNTYIAGQELASGLRALGVLDKASAVLDIGCGNGRLAMGLVAQDYPGNYLGLDVVRQSVDFCKAAFQPWPNFEFDWLNVYNGRYFGRGSIPASQVVFPVPDQSIDLVTAFSLFSHLADNESAARYVAEAWRVLRPGGHIVSTWFVSPPLPVSRDPAKTVYPLAFVEGLFGGWEVVRQGYDWPGGCLTGQMLVVAKAVA